MTPLMTPLLTYDEVAQWLALPPGTLYGLVHKGEIPHVRISARIVRFEREALEAWIVERRQAWIDPPGKIEAEEGRNGAESSREGWTVSASRVCLGYSAHSKREGGG